MRVTRAKTSGIGIIVSGSGGRRAEFEHAFTLELATWLKALLATQRELALRVALSRVGSETSLFDLAVSAASLRDVVQRIETIALETTRHLGHQIFALRCYGAVDILGTKHFAVAEETRGSRLPEMPVSAATLLGHYERMVSAQSERLGRLEGHVAAVPSPADAGGAPQPPPNPDPNNATTQIGDKLALLLPVIANAVAVKFGLADVALPTASPEREVLRALLASINEEQVAGLAAVLRPEQLVAMTALRERLVNVSARASDEQLPNGSAGNPSENDDARRSPNPRPDDGRSRRAAARPTA